MTLRPSGAVSLGAAVCLVILASATPVSAQSKTVWNGVYSAAQAARGKELVGSYCAMCHDPTVSGFNQRRFSGPSFLKNWDTATVNELFTKISKTMPQNSPGALMSNQYVDIIAHIFSLNGFPDGRDELPVDSAVLSDIQIVGKDGPLPAETGSLIRVIGCLARSPDNAWLLTNTIGPMRTRAMEPSTGADLAASEKIALGTQTVRVQGQVDPDPAPHLGHKMEAKGLLIKTPTEARIRITSLQMISAACAP